MPRIKLKVISVNEESGYEIVEVYRRGWYAGQIVVYGTMISQYQYLSAAEFGSVNAIIKQGNGKYIRE